MLKNSFLEGDCHAHLFNHNNMIENEISCGTNILKHRFSKHCSKVKEPTHHPRLLPSKHAKQNSGRTRLYSSSSRSRGLTGSACSRHSVSQTKARSWEARERGAFARAEHCPSVPAILMALDFCTTTVYYWLHYYVATVLARFAYLLPKPAIYVLLGNNSWLNLVGSWLCACKGLKPQWKVWTFC